MPQNISVRVRVDKRALDRELRSRSGTTGKVVAGFAGLTTVAIKEVFRERAGGAWWKLSTSISESGRGVKSTTFVRKTPRHVIRAKNAPALIFFWQKENKWVRTQSVNHPGSTPPAKLVLSGIERASRRVTTITRGAVTTYSN